MRRPTLAVSGARQDEVFKAHGEHSFSINLVRRRTDPQAIETYNHKQLNEDKKQHLPARFRVARES
jgi:hypothetical protein